MYITGQNRDTVSNLLKRILTGTAIIIVITVAVMVNSLTFLLLCALINFFGVLEFYRLLRVDQDRVREVLGVSLASCILFFSCFVIAGYIQPVVMLVCIPLMSAVLITELYLKSDKPLLNLAVTFFVIPYITFPLILLFGSGFVIANGAYEPTVILGYFVLLWVHDSGAYICGSLFGEQRLFERVSPNKTWEGSLGGALFTMVLIYVNYIHIGKVALSGWIIIGLSVIVMGTFGDLVKSMIKRSVGVKDSGKILPGHGGILDRFDSLIGSAPFVYAYLILFNAV